MTRMGMPSREESALNRTLHPTNKAPIKKKLLMVVASNGELLVALRKNRHIICSSDPFVWLNCASICSFLRLPCCFYARRAIGAKEVKR
ncbi:hypothetical protein D3C85_1488260 [compost metagenome]